MCSIPTHFVWKKDYTVFNEDGKLTSKSLNVFQRFFRVIGFYKNTRLEVVGTIAYETLFKPNLTWSPKEKQTLIQIVRKLTKTTHFFLLPSAPRYCHLGEERLSTGEIVKYEGDLDNRGYHFIIKIIKNNSKIREARIELTQGFSNRFNIVDIREWQISPVLNEKSFLTDPEDVLAKKTYLFLAKIVDDSHRLKGLDMVNTRSEIAKNYGFSGKIIEITDSLKLEKTEAHQIAAQCLLSIPVAVDFLLPEYSI